jgi:Holliday junction resolvasome RuvABC endonuclease subunit
MILKIKDIEKKLHFNLKKNTFSLGVDTASTTGLAILETNEDTLRIKIAIFKLPEVKKSDELSDKFVEKLEFMLRSIRDFKKEQFGCKKATNTIMVLENSFLSFNPVAFGLLRMLCGIVFAELFDNFEKIKIIFPLSARKIVGFKSQLSKGTKSKEKKQEIIDFINNIFNTEERSDDICDALMLALCGLKEE